MKRKKSERAKMKKLAWSAFSLYIRKSNEVNGRITCYTCGKKYSLKQMSAGHGIGGRNNAVLFDERIVKPQDYACNVIKSGNYGVFARKLIGEFGLKKYDEIVAGSKKVLQYKTQDFQEIYEKYTRKLEELTKK